MQLILIFKKIKVVLFITIRKNLLIKMIEFNKHSIGGKKVSLM